MRRNNLVDQEFQQRRYSPRISVDRQTAFLFKLMPRPLDDIRRQRRGAVIDDELANLRLSRPFHIATMWEMERFPIENYFEPDDYLS